MALQYDFNCSLPSFNLGFLTSTIIYSTVGLSLSKITISADLVESLPNLIECSNFIDFLVGVREEYFYKIRYVAGDHFTGFSETIRAFAEEPLNTNVPINDEIGGIQYAYWDFPFQTFEQIYHQFIIHE